MPLDFAVILLFFATAVPWLGRRRMRLLLSAAKTEKRQRLALYSSTFVFQWLAVAVIYWRARAHGVSRSALALAAPNTALIAVISVILCGFVFANQFFSLRRLAARPQDIKGSIAELAQRIFPQDNSERAAFLVLAVTVAICEELIYRGFAQFAFQSWLRESVVAGVLASAILFAVAHLYQGSRGLVSTFVVGLVFAGLRAWTGSLIPEVLAHFLADSIAGVLAPGAIQRALELRAAGPGSCYILYI
jgi:membrane protease YdiL (CAAX protease family)